jgi:hypothetical protein
VVPSRILVLCLLVNGHEDVAGFPDIAHRDTAEDLPRIIRLFGEFLELLVVEFALGECTVALVVRQGKPRRTPSDPHRDNNCEAEPSS